MATRFSSRLRAALAPPPSTKVRWKGAKFVPIEVVEALVAGRAIQEDGWAIDTVSQCLLPIGNQPTQAKPPAQFEFLCRSSAAVDRAGNGCRAALDRVSRIHTRQRTLDGGGFS
jgi:hypothetical protein